MQRNRKSSADTDPLSKSAPGRDFHKSIVLVGLMGAGKSTVGRRLAQRLGMDFVDADVEIEKAAAMTIADMFDRYGEEEFRDGERRVVARILAGPPVVLATGGGAFADPETRAMIRDWSISVWLDASVDVLSERVSRRDTRPLLRGRTPREVLEKLALERTDAYRSADIRVTSEVAPHSRIVDAIVAELAKWNS